MNADSLTEDASGDLPDNDVRFGIPDFWGDRRGYINDVKCTNAEILEFVDYILSDRPDAMILLHSDHGSAFALDWELPIDAWPEEQFEERFGVLMALRLPAQCGSLLYPSLSPVNIYATLFACLSDTEPVLKPDVAFISPKEKHPQDGTAYPHRRTQGGAGPPKHRTENERS